MANLTNTVVIAKLQTTLGESFDASNGVRLALDITGETIWFSVPADWYIEDSAVAKAMNEFLQK